MSEVNRNVVDKWVNNLAPQTMFGGMTVTTSAWNIFYTYTPQGVQVTISPQRYLLESGEKIRISLLTGNPIPTSAVVVGARVMCDMAMNKTNGAYLIKKEVNENSSSSSELPYYLRLPNYMNTNSSKPPLIIYSGMQGAVECDYEDIMFKPVFYSGCIGSIDKKCNPKIEFDKWQDYNEKVAINGKFGILTEKSYMYCLNGKGILWCSDSGQMPPSLKEQVENNRIELYTKKYEEGEITLEQLNDILKGYTHKYTVELPPENSETIILIVPDMTGYLVPPSAYSPTGEWSTQDLIDFKLMEDGATVLWGGCTPELIEARNEFEELIAEKGWVIDYSSAYRPLIYQAHFYDIRVEGTNSNHADSHGLSSRVAYPNPSSPHISGVAFDATIRNEQGIAMNGMSFVDPELVIIANQAGLNINVPNDYVHFQLR